MLNSSDVRSFFARPDSLTRDATHFSRSLVRSFARSPGDEIEIDGQFFIVEKTRVRWKLERGRYVRDHKRLDVLGTGRYLSNMFLNSLLEIETSDEEEEGGGRR